MVEFYRFDLRGRLAWRRYALEGRKSLSDYDWERGVWKIPALHKSRSKSQRHMVLTGVALATSILVALGSMQFPALSRSASDVLHNLKTWVGIESGACQSSNLLG